jgi:hypothetical protein
MAARRRGASGSVAAPRGITEAVSSAIVNVSAASWACTTSRTMLRPS